MGNENIMIVTKMMFRKFIKVKMIGIHTIIVENYLMEGWMELASISEYKSTENKRSKRL